MPGATDIAYGNEKFDSVYYLAAITFPTLAANASSDTNITFPGCLPLDLVSWNMQAPALHLVIDNIYVSSANTLTIRWGTDGTGVATSTVNILLGVVRPTNANLGTSALPAAIV
jgi:hypothetical protein